MFRLSSRADPAFLAEMLYEAVNWRDDGAEERPPLEELLANPEIRRYVEGWGRKGDVALVALDRLDEPVGAAWYRVFETAEPGYGFVAADVPELSIAVYPECRGQHVGGLLLGSVVSRAKSDGYRAISLSDFCRSFASFDLGSLGSLKTLLANFSSNCGTSAAMRQGNSETSMCRIGRTPERPSTRDRQ